MTLGRTGVILLTSDRQKMPFQQGWLRFEWGQCSFEHRWDVLIHLSFVRGNVSTPGHKLGCFRLIVKLQHMEMSIFFFQENICIYPLL